MELVYSGLALLVSLKIAIIAMNSADTFFAVSSVGASDHGGGRRLLPFAELNSLAYARDIALIVSTSHGVKQVEVNSE